MLYPGVKRYSVTTKIVFLVEIAIVARTPRRKKIGK